MNETPTPLGKRNYIDTPMSESFWSMLKCAHKGISTR